MCIVIGSVLISIWYNITKKATQLRIVNFITLSNDLNHLKAQ